MKSTTLIIPLLTTLAAAQGFFDECAKPWSLGYRNRVHFVIATCPGPDDKKYTSTINLNDCLSNSEGVLRADKSSLPTGIREKRCPASCRVGSNSIFPTPSYNSFGTRKTVMDMLNNEATDGRTVHSGFAFHSCSSCTAATPSTNAELTCQCKQTGGQPKTTIIDLNTVVSNTDGIIGCFGLPGEWSFWDDATPPLIDCAELTWNSSSTGFEVAPSEL
ncbi:uncharacterized protein BCR38DRAFT_404947 [Pseudomassariella vexata]|uniref:Cyanovirin-N domain-containing protein n=1 Tax=Pseudomassariella vexata TaxID=1141098 RepID=A0A1Y2EK39_9PEZI|nr:uncharacterized protein BCR38DRAFT_404947 [Pseudomassariella vexata]ORY71918.1 hypothetical protein BCR38DRAFT_404947 [Pseudomassariella vexata]